MTTIAAVPAVQTAPAVPGTGVTHSTSLYVGDLLPEVNEAALYDTFNNIGPVASVRVCRDAITRRSLGYAYVNFQNPADAERALDAMNFEPIQGKSCRVMWCQRDPTARRSGVGNIFVNGLDKSIDNKALYDAFSIFGNILSVKVVSDSSGNSAGRGFVHFETAEDAQEAIDKADGTLLKDKKINVARFKSRKERLEEFGQKEFQFQNVFVKNIGNLNEEALTRIFEKFGSITSIAVARDNDAPTKTKGFGFVCFGNTESAKRAVDELNGTEVEEGLKIFVGRAMKKGERSALLRREHENRKKEHQLRSRGVNLYVKHLDETHDDNNLRKVFEEFGNITSVHVMRDEKGNSRCFGFVSFSLQEEATKAITELNGRMIGSKPLVVALAQPKEERQQHLSLQHRQRMQFQRQPQFMPPGPAMYPQQMVWNVNPAQFGARQPYFNGARLNTPGRFPTGQQFPPTQGFPQGQQFPPNQQFQQQQIRGARPAHGAYPRGPGGAAPRNNRYSAQARNAPLQQQQQQQHPQAQLTSVLASADPERQKQMLGDTLYPLVAERYPQAAGKLTGMLLQMDNSEILHLLDDVSLLDAELEKANEVLRAHAQ